MRKPTLSGNLWKHADFMRMWKGQSISEVGSQVSQLAIPFLAAKSLHASPLSFSLLGVFAFMPFILFALPAGVWVDRLHRRNILIVGDAARALLLAIIPILWALHDLRIWHLLVLEFVIGIFTVFFNVAYQSYLPSLVGRDDLIEGNSKLQLTVSVAQIGGPGLSGTLIGFITAPYAIVVDAVSFVISSIFMIRVRHREAVPEQKDGEVRPKMWPQVKEGLNWVVGHRWLRYIATFTATSNFMTSVLFSIFLLYCVRTLQLSSFAIGFMFAVGSAGSAIGAIYANKIRMRFGVGPTIVGTAIFSSFGGLLYPLAPHSFPLPFLMLGQAIFGFGAVAYNITQVSLRQTITPERLQGRMNAAMRWIVWGTIPLGTITGGALATVWSLHTALWIGAIGELFAAVPLLLSTVRHIGEMPPGVEEQTPAEAELAGGLIEGHPLPEPAAADL